MRKLMILMVVAMFAAGCGGGNSSSTGWAVKYNGKGVPFTKTHGYANFRPDLQQGQILIANFEPAIKDDSVMGVADTKNAGEAFVGFYFKTNNQSDYNNSVKPGVIPEIGSVWISNGDTKDRVSFTEAGKTPGKLEITEVTETTIKGKIEVTKGDSSVIGPFEARILKKTP